MLGVHNRIDSYGEKPRQLFTAGHACRSARAVRAERGAHFVRAALCPGTKLHEEPSMLDPIK